MIKVDVDAEIDEWKRSREFSDLLHGDELVNDFDKWVAEQGVKNER